MGDRDWILVGMMGSGKSTVGRILAEKSGRAFQDTDQIIVQRLGRPIHQLFAIYGPEAFRDHEGAVLRSLQSEGRVLATGGGIVIRDSNWAELRRLGRVAFLDLPAELLIERLERSSRRRPLLEFEDWKDRLRALLEERRPLYERADFAVTLESEDLEGAALKLLKAFERPE